MRTRLRTALLSLALGALVACGGEAGPGTTALGSALAATSLAAPAPAPPAPAAPAPVVSAPAKPAPVASVALNQAILDVVNTYARDGSNPYAWSRGVNTDGVSQELWWRGTLLAAPETGGGIHCSGITYEVYLRALAAAVGEDAGPDAETLLAMKDTWYVRDGNDRGPVAALVEAGLGEAVPGLAGLKPGDLVQFWRNSGKGHSVVFINHTRNSDGSLRGMVYWSAQGTSGGVGMRRVSPGLDVNQIAPDRLYGVRPVWPGRWHGG